MAMELGGAGRGGGRWRGIEGVVTPLGHADRCRALHDSPERGHPVLA